MTYYQQCLKAWANWNGQKGTAKQLEKLGKSFPEFEFSDLERMLSERNLLPVKGG